MEIIAPKAQLLWITPNSEQIIERAGRVCYKSENKISEDSAGRFIQMLVARKHEAILEHASASILFVCDRGVTHELVRHRLVSYAQESTRYCNYATQKFGSSISLIPMLQGLTPEQISRRFDLYQRIQDVYFAEIEEGVAPQQARDNLPTCLKTEIVTTANLREWRHIFALRRAPTAHPQIKIIMDMAFNILHQECPNVFNQEVPNG